MGKLRLGGESTGLPSSWSLSLCFGVFSLREDYSQIFFEIRKEISCWGCLLISSQQHPQGSWFQVSASEGELGIRHVVQCTADSAHLLPRVPGHQCTVCCACSPTAQASSHKVTEAVKQLFDILPAGLKPKHPAEWLNEIPEASLFQMRIFYSQNIYVFFSFLFSLCPFISPSPVFSPSLSPSYPSPSSSSHTSNFLLFLLLKKPSCCFIYVFFSSKSSF